jgi:FKBP-type peptidyl-prolyl cis-trans isomerase FkpA
MKQRLMWVTVCLAAIGCGGSGGPGSAKGGPYTGQQPAFSQTDLTVGEGTRAARTARITVNYTGWVYDPTAPDFKGSQFDTSIGREPFSFTLGAGEVIPGWDQGFNDMRVGGKRRAATLEHVEAQNEEGEDASVADGVGLKPAV